MMSKLVSKLVVLVVLLTTIAAMAHAQNAGAVIWSADMETGDISEWSLSHGGNQENSGTPGVNGIFSVASKEVAHSGAWSDKLSITAPSTSGGSSGTRMFRWAEPRTHRDLYYDVWYYIPTYYTVGTHFVMLMQFKTRTPDNTHIDPVWAFYLDDSHPGQYYLKTGWGWGKTFLAGPHSGDAVSGKWFTQTIAPLPIRQWVHLEAFLHESNKYDGQVTIWQNGVKIFDFTNVVTSYNNCNYNAWCAENEWSVNLYSNGLSPDPAVAYIDDARIMLPGAGTTISPPSNLTATVH